MGVYLLIAHFTCHVFTRCYGYCMRTIVALVLLGLYLWYEQITGWSMGCIICTPLISFVLMLSIYRSRTCIWEILYMIFMSRCIRNCVPFVSPFIPMANSTLWPVASRRSCWPRDAR